MSQLDSRDIFPPPQIDGHLPLDEKSLTALLSTTPDSPDVKEALGAFLLREGSYALAVQALQSARDDRPESVSVLTNLAVAQLHLGNRGEALQLLKRAVLSGGSNPIPHLHLARLLSESDPETAAHHYRRFIDRQGDRGEVLAELAALYVRLGNLELARASFERAHGARESSSEAELWLALDSFQAGAAQFDDGKLEEALATWHAGWLRYGHQYQSVREIVHGLDDRRARHRDSEHRSSARARWEKSVQSEPSGDLSDRRRHATYSLLLSELFIVGVLPECYSPLRVEDGLTFWQENLRARGEHPYPHFRIAILRALVGELAAAEEELRWCQDKLLPKKQHSLRLPAVLRLVSDLRRAEFELTHLGSLTDTDGDWTTTDLSEFEVQRWQRAEFGAGQAVAWRSASFSPEEARRWLTADFSPAEARAWTSAGFSDPLDARAWAKASVPAEEAYVWYATTDFDRSVALTWYRAGFTAEEALNWAQVFAMPWEARRWADEGFGYADAYKWRLEGIVEPLQAKRLSQQENSGGAGDEGTINLDESSDEQP